MNNYITAEEIYCEHSEPGPKGRPGEWAIDIGKNRIVILCDLCAARASMDVVKELLRELRPQLTRPAQGKR